MGLIASHWTEEGISLESPEATSGSIIRTFFVSTEPLTDACNTDIVTIMVPNAHRIGPSAPSWLMMWQ